MRPDLSELLYSHARKFGATIAGGEVELFDRYLALIQEYNKKLSLTAIEDEEGIVVKHFIDSLAAASFVLNGERALDIGSGMGCPGLALKIVRPHLKLVLIESNRKKAAFIGQAIRALKLTDARAIAKRAEDKDYQFENAGQFEVVMARAVGKLDLLAELAAPYLKIGGRLIAYKGAKAKEELEEFEATAKNDTFAHEVSFEYSLPLESGPRFLLVLKKN